MRFMRHASPMSSLVSLSCIMKPLSFKRSRTVRRQTLIRKASGKSLYTSRASTLAPSGCRTFRKDFMMTLSSAGQVLRQPVLRPRMPRRELNVATARRMVVCFNRCCRGFLTRAAISAYFNGLTSEPGDGAYKSNTTRGCAHPCALPLLPARPLHPQELRKTQQIHFADHHH